VGLVAHRRVRAHITEPAPNDDAWDERIASVDTSFITVVLCTRARRALLAQCLASLRDLRDDNHEILVVENDEEPVASNLASGKVRWTHEPRPGLAFARNRGIAEAKGDIIVFVDDDCEVDAEWLAHLRAAFRDPDVTCVTGRVVPASLARPSQRWFERLAGFDRGTDTMRFSVVPGDVVMPNEAGQLGTGCNMAFRRDVFTRVGTFDPALDTPALIRGGGDLDMFARVLEGREVVDYAPGAIVRHHHRTTLVALAKQLFGYGVGIGALCTKYRIEGRADLRDVARVQRSFLRWTFRPTTGRRLVGASLGLIEVVGDVVGVVAYPFVRRRNGRSSQL
jgi:GT2 family glycosyltransferase